MCVLGCECACGAAGAPRQTAEASNELAIWRESARSPARQSQISGLHANSGPGEVLGVVADQRRPSCSRQLLYRRTCGCHACAAKTPAQQSPPRLRSRELLLLIQIHERIYKVFSWWQAPTGGDCQAHQNCSAPRALSVTQGRRTMSPALPHDPIKPPGAARPPTRSAAPQSPGAGLPRAAGAPHSSGRPTQRPPVPARCAGGAAGTGGCV